MNINLKENPLKLTIAGNLFAINGFVCSMFYLLAEKTGRHLALTNSGNNTEATIVFLSLLIVILLPVLSVIVSIFVFILEQVFKHRLKHKFFKENIFYTVIFYIFFVLSIASLVFSIRFLFGTF